MRRDSPVKRRNPSGQVVWVAWYTGRDGRRHIAKPSWNRGKGTFARKGEAQRAIDEAYGLSDRPDTLGDYFATWTDRHPRSERTNATNNHRISRVTDVGIEGIPLKDWPLRELRRRHALGLLDYMLRTEGRATTGAVGIIRSLSAMTEDAITDEVCDLNPFKGVRISQRSKGEEEAPPDPRLHLRGNAPLRESGRTLRGNGPRLHRHWSPPWRGPPAPPRRFRRRNPPGPPHCARGSDPRGSEDRSRRAGRGAGCSCPGNARLDAGRADPAQRGGLRAAYDPNRPHVVCAELLPRRMEATQDASGLDIRPHECRHSFVTHLRDAGVNDADLAEIAGHRVETMLARYTHAIGEGSIS
jgi:hypothetical protein